MTIAPTDYRLQPQLPLAAELLRVARAQCRFARACLRRRGAQLGESVHDARRALRRVRALLLLVRPALEADAYERAVAPWREAGRHLSPLRDADSTLEALERLRGLAPGLLTPAAIAHLGRGLRQRRERLARGAEPDLAAAMAALAEAQRAIPGWTSAIDADCLWNGLRQGHARAARAARRAAAAGPDSEAWHRFRQRVRAHWLQLELLRLAWPPLLGVQAQEVRRLSQLLGRERDLLLLDQRLAALRGELAPDCARDAVRAELARLREGMRAQSQADAALLFAEGARASARRIRGYWSVAAAAVEAGNGAG